MDHISNKTIRQVLFLLLLLGIMGLLCWNLIYFIPALLVAYTLFILLRPAFHFLTHTWGWNMYAATIVLILLSAALIFFPVNWIIQTLGTRLAGILSDPQELWKSTEIIVRNIETQYKIVLWTPETFKTVSEWIYIQARGIASATFDGFVTILVGFLLLWFMLMNEKRLESSLTKWLPMQAENGRNLRHQLNNLVYSNALGIPLMGLVQGVAGLLAYWLAGVQDPWLWFAVTFLAGMMPLFGAMLAYVPLSLILLANGSPLTALFVLMYGIVVIGSVDNLARMWVLNKLGHTHPLSTFFGVIIGLKLFGFIGFVFGPILISLAILLLQIYQKEFGSEG